MYWVFNFIGNLLCVVRWTDTIKFKTMWFRVELSKVYCGNIVRVTLSNRKCQTKIFFLRK